MDPDEIKEVLRLHADWLAGDESGLRADLSHADLRDADLRNAVLRHAVLRHAVLRHAVLRHADLRHAVLSHADLSWADLSGADLRHADLRSAIVGGAACSALRPEAIGLPPADPALLLRVCEAATQPGALAMKTWHSCETAHCLAGWAVHLAGPAGYALEAMTSPSVAGSLLIPDAAHLFYEFDSDAVREFCAGVLASSPA